MVVANLENYVHEKIPGALYLSNLKELINEEISRGVKEPTIVLDHSAVPWLFQPDEATILNLKPKDDKEKVERFLKKIISCPARLIVVLRNKSTKDVKKWYFKNKIKIFNFDNYKETGVLDDSIRQQLNLPAVMCNKLTFLSFSDEKYSALISNGKIVKDVAKIAVKENCLAVIGRDTNYLIYEGIRHYILTNSINIETLDCLIYDRNKLIQHLELKSHHLPLLATLSGNDVVDKYWLKGFHQRISGSKSNKFLDVARKIRHISDNPYNHIKYMVKEVKHRDVTEEVLKKSLDLYLSFETSSPTDTMSFCTVFANKRLRKKEWSPLTFSIFMKEEFWTSCRTKLNPYLPFSAALLRPIRKHIYGILFHDLHVTAVKEYCLDEVEECESEIIPVCVVPEIPFGCKHPGLIKLFNGSQDVKSLKWDLFCSAITSNLNSSALRQLSPKLIIPVLALHYLSMKAFKNVELKTFLVVAFLVSEGIRINVEPCELDLNVVHLTLLYNETCCILKILNEACGLVVSLQDSCFCNFYDGAYVFHVYKELEKGTDWKKFFRGNFELEQKFCNIMEMILLTDLSKLSF